jgi:hypothetical protein
VVDMMICESCGVWWCGFREDSIIVLWHDLCLILIRSWRISGKRQKAAFWIVIMLLVQGIVLCTATLSSFCLTLFLYNLQTPVMTSHEVIDWSHCFWPWKCVIITSWNALWAHNRPIRHIFLSCTAGTYEYLKRTMDCHCVETFRWV